MESNTKNDFVKQAMLLSVSGILVRIIGLLYGFPLTGIIGDLGNGYYTAAYNVYSIILLVCSYSIPMAVSKIIAAQNAMGKYKTAHRVFICSLIYVIGVGGVAAILTFIFAANVVDVSEAIPAMRILAPTIFFSGILSVFRGFFQAKNTMVPTAVSQLLEQIMNAIVSISAAVIFTRMVYGSSETVVAQFGAAGGAMGTGAGVGAGLIFLLLVYLKHRDHYRSQLSSSEERQAASYREVFIIIFSMVTPVILSTCIYNISTVLDMKVFYKMMFVKGFDSVEISKLYGIFSRKYNVLVNVPIALASSMSSAVVPGVSVAFERRNYKEACRKVASATKFTMLLTIPAAIGMSVLAKPIMDLLFWGSLPIAANLLRLGGLTIVFYGLSTVLNGVLQGMGKVKVPLKNAFTALIAHLIVLVALLYFTNLGLYAILIATVLYSMIVSLLNLRAVRKLLHYQQEMKQTFWIPLAGSLVMGVFSLGSYKLSALLLAFLIGSARAVNAIALVLSIAISVAVYLFWMLRMGDLAELVEDSPKMGKLVKFLRKMKLIRK